MEAYCLKCKEKLPIQDAKKEEKSRYSGSCSKCGKKVSTFVKRAEVPSETESVPESVPKDEESHS